jgi:hypothetical protein
LSEAHYERESRKEHKHNVIYQEDNHFHRFDFVKLSTSDSYLGGSAFCIVGEEFTSAPTFERRLLKPKKLEDCVRSCSREKVNYSSLSRQDIESWAFASH